MNSDRYYKTRDSATSVLRRLGVSAKNYNKFIKVLEDGTLLCQLSEVEKFLVALQPQSMAEVGNPIPETGLVPKNSKPIVSAEKRMTSRGLRPPQVIKNRAPQKYGTVSGEMRKLILEGKSNQEVWEITKNMFSLDDSKKHYPAWYRCQMRRGGLKI